MVIIIYQGFHKAISFAENFLQKKYGLLNYEQVKIQINPQIKKIHVFKLNFINFSAISDFLLNILLENQLVFQYLLSK